MELSSDPRIRYAARVPIATGRWAIASSHTFMESCETGEIRESTTRCMAVDSLTASSCLAASEEPATPTFPKEDSNRLRDVSSGTSLSQRDFIPFELLKEALLLLKPPSDI